MLVVHSVAGPPSLVAVALLTDGNIEALHAPVGKSWKGLSQAAVSNYVVSRTTPDQLIGSTSTPALGTSSTLCGSLMHLKIIIKVRDHIDRDCGPVNNSI